MPDKYGVDKSLNSMAGLSAYENGGPGSGNFGHAGRPGKRGGSGSGSGISKAITTQKKFQDQAKIVQEDIEDRIGQKVKKGEEYTALDEASKSRFKEFHGEDGTEYTYDKENGMITETNPETGDQEVVTKKAKTLYGTKAYKAIDESHKKAREQDEKTAAEDRKQISSELDDFAGFGGYSRRDGLKTISDSLTNLTTDIKAAKEQVKRLKDASDSRKRQDRATTLTRLGEAEKAIKEADRLLKDKDFIKGVGDSKKTLIEMAKTELKRGQKTLSDYYDKLDKGQ